MAEELKRYQLKAGKVWDLNPDFKPGQIIELVPSEAEPYLDVLEEAPPPASGQAAETPPVEPTETPAA